MKTVLSLLVVSLSITLAVLGFDATRCAVVYAVIAGAALVLSLAGFFHPILWGWLLSLGVLIWWTLSTEGPPTNALLGLICVILLLFWMGIRLLTARHLPESTSMVLSLVLLMVHAMAFGPILELFASLCGIEHGACGCD